MDRGRSNLPGVRRRQYAVCAEELSSLVPYTSAMAIDDQRQKDCLPVLVHGSFLSADMNFSGSFYYQMSSPRLYSICREAWLEWGMSGLGLPCPQVSWEQQQQQVGPLSYAQGQILVEQGRREWKGRGGACKCRRR